MKKRSQKQDIVVYQARNGAVELRGDYKRETVWATQAQIFEVFEVDQSVVSRHIRNIFKDGEVSAKSNMQKMHIANSDKPVTLYSLDVILSVGYRVNSKRATHFRKWATRTLRQHIIDGYTINRSRIANNYSGFLAAVEDIKALMPAGSAMNADSILELITLFADTWLSLDAYDKEAFVKIGATKKRVLLAAVDLSEAIGTLKRELIDKGEATDLFASERDRGSVESIVGNVMQSFDGKDLYPSVEAKAANLLYFIVKNHPFVDGNKRSGAFSFIWFLKKVGLLNTARLTPQALTALTLLIAESKPKDKERIIGLILLLLKK